jgi:hypothetical protein
VDLEEVVEAHPIVVVAEVDTAIMAVQIVLEVVVVTTAIKWDISPMSARISPSPPLLHVSGVGTLVRTTVRTSAMNGPAGTVFLISIQRMRVRKTLNLISSSWSTP